MFSIPQHQLIAPLSINSGDIILVNEDVFILNKEGRHMFSGQRGMLMEIQSDGMPGYCRVRVLRSSGVNSFPSGVSIERPISNLMRGRVLIDQQLKDSYKSGGHLEGMDSGGNKVQSDSARQGGIGKGSSHADGGIKAMVGTEQRPIEFEGEEIILTAPVSSNQEKYDFEGKKLTGREIASRINVDNGGVSFAEGGDVGSCRCSGKTYSFNGSSMSDRQIIQHFNK